MPLIRQIEVRILTGDRVGAGGSGSAFFLGIGGREFRLDNPAYEDFRRGDYNEFRLGEESNVRYPEHNDPRSPFPLATQSLHLYPKYIRLQTSSDENWNLEHIAVTINRGDDLQQLDFASLSQNQNIWLGNRNGLVFHFG